MANTSKTAPKKTGMTGAETRKALNLHPVREEKAAAKATNTAKAAPKKAAAKKAAPKAAAKKTPLAKGERKFPIANYEVRRRVYERLAYRMDFTARAENGSLITNAPLATIKAELAKIVERMQSKGMKTD